MKKKFFTLLTLLLAVCSGAWAETETIFSANPTAAWSVPASTKDSEITSSYATITGGKMYLTNEQTSAKDLIKKQGEMAFQHTNNNTFFKVVLDKALQAGDIISTRMQSRTDADLGLWFSTATSRPGTEPTSKIVLATASSQAWVTAPTYTVAEGDGICGQTTFYIYRHTGKSTYFNTFTITREEEDNRLPVTLSFPDASYDVNLGESFTAPTLTVDPSAASSEVVYSSSNEAVATVNSTTGAITLKAGGTTTITASISDSNTYTDASASYSLKVTDPNASGYTDEAANIIWPFQDGTTLTPENIIPADAFLSTSVSYGSMTLGNYNAITFKEDTENTAYTFNTITNNTGSSVSNINIDFLVTPMKGITFKPTNVYFEAARIGHNNGKVTISAIYGDGTTKTLKAEHEVARNNTSGFSIYTTEDINITDGVESGNAFTLRITLNKLDNGKADAFRNIRISGIVNGAPEAVTIYTITAEPNDGELGTVSGGADYIKDDEVTLTATPNTFAKFVKWQKNGEDIEGGATINFTASENATYTAVFKRLYMISFIAGEGADKGTTPNILQATYEETSYTTPSANYYVAMPGYTATGWTDGTNDYNFGEEIILTGDLQLQPKFEANSASFSDMHVNNITVTYNFNPKTGAPVLNIENATGYYVQQADINGTKIDVPMYINNIKGSAIEEKTGKTNNTSSGATTAQINEGSKFTIPAVYGMTVVLNGSNNISTTTVGGNTPSSGSGTKTATYIYQGSDETIDIVFGNDGKYYSSIEVTYPKTHTYIDVSSVGYRTFASSSALDFTNNIEGLTAYRATVGTDKKVTFTPIDCPVPVGEGMLIKAEEGRYYIPLATSTPTEIDNELVGVTKETVVEGAGIFVLMNTDEKGVGFYKTTAESFTVGANTAYLPASVAGARSFIGLNGEGDETTGIAEIEKMRKAESEISVYNLSGQRVSKPTKGLYIKDGKKVIRK
jgi:hypothetical protein